MIYKHLLILIVLMMTVSQAGAEQSPTTTDEKSGNKAETKELSGMSIVGNDEAPKSLYIVPWKSSELGQETGMNMMLNERDVPVDREVFMRQLEYYEVSTTQPGAEQ
jgi:hypothetical protein